jgi:hypothetical protein
MPRVRLTDVSISKLPYSKAQITYWDEGGGLPGFGVRVGARRKTFVLVVNRGYRIKLGTYPLTSLKDARLEAYRRLSDPQGQKQPVIAPPASEVVENFLEIHHARSRPRWRREQERLLTRHLLEKHRGTAFNRITTRDILAIIDSLQGVPSGQLHVYRAFKTLFTWARKRKVIPTRASCAAGDCFTLANEHFHPSDQLGRARANWRRINNFLLCPIVSGTLAYFAAARRGHSSICTRAISL